MGQIAYGEVPQTATNGTGVGFFSLRDDGDEAIVRIMHDSPATFEICAVHPTTVNGKFRNVNCIRNAKDPIDMCPMCQAGTPLSYKFFMHLIQYDRDQQGNIVPMPKIWERGMKFADMIVTYCNEYAPLSDTLFKIKRNGKKGSTDTTYQLLPANPNVYRPDLYPKVEDAFANYSVIGTAVHNTDFAGMQALVNPAAQQAYVPKQPVATPVAPVATPVAQSYAPPVSQAPVYQQPVQATPAYSAPAYQPAPQQSYAPPAGYQAPPVNTDTRTYAAPQYEPPVNTAATASGVADTPAFTRPRRYDNGAVTPQ